MSEYIFNDWETTKLMVMITPDLNKIYILIVLSCRQYPWSIGRKWVFLILTVISPRARVTAFEALALFFFCLFEVFIKYVYKFIFWRFALKFIIDFSCCFTKLICLDL